MICMSAVVNKAYCAPTVLPDAKIVSVSNSGGYVTSSNSASGAKAAIGRWDTAYPNPETGAQAPGLEPNGPSSFTIDIAVGSGGTVSFSYNIKTYDAGIYDWFSAKLMTSSGPIILVPHLGKPGSSYGSYWVSATVDFSEIDLTPYIGQNVQFIFTVQQDGWGDQTQANITNFQLNPACGILPLNPISDAEGISFENGGDPDPTTLNLNLQAGYSCLINRITAAGGTYRLNSAYRPPSYQVHLGEVWRKWQAIKYDSTPQCADRKVEIKREVDKHELGNLRIAPAGPSGAHTQHAAFDMIWNLPQLTNIDNLATQCNLSRRMRIVDPVHFEYLPSSVPAP